MKITHSARNRKIYMCTFYTEERGHTHTHTYQWSRPYDGRGFARECPEACERRRRWCYCRHQEQREQNTGTVSILLLTLYARAQSSSHRKKITVRSIIHVYIYSRIWDIVLFITGIYYLCAKNFLLHILFFFIKK